jgi:hypothetical protein
MNKLMIVLSSLSLVLVTAVPSLAQASLGVRRLGSCDTPGWAQEVAVAGNYAYVADWEGGLRVVNISNPASPFEVGFCDTPENAYTVAVSGNYAYVADYTPRLRVINITNPAAPVEVGFYDLPAGAFCVAVAGDYAYVADDIAGLRVVNITNPAAPFQAGFCGTPGIAFGVAVAGNYAYVVDWYGGLSVVNITNPAAPYEVGFYDWPPYANRVAVSGNYAYVADADNGLGVVNITNPSNPVGVGFFDTPGNARDVAVSGNYAYVADGNSGLRVVNITNPAAPFEVGFYDTLGQAGGVTVQGNIAYVAQGGSGLGIYDCSAAIGDPCVADLTVALPPNNPNFPGSQNVFACARIVPGLFTRIVVPVNNPSNVPMVSVTAGCPSDPGCAPAEGWNFSTPWQYDAGTTSYWRTIDRAGGGCCVTVHLDYVLPVELLSFSAVGGDGEVLLRWETASETGTERFEIERDGRLVHHTPAAGDATGHSYEWTDRNLVNGEGHHYALWSVEMNGERELLSETDATPRAGISNVTEYALHGNYPNPFNPVTEIVYDLPEAGTVSLKVFDLMGREEAVLVNGEKPAGQHTISFDARDLPSGVYFCRMTADEFTASHKMMLIR